MTKLSEMATGEVIGKVSDEAVDIRGGATTSTVPALRVAREDSTTNTAPPVLALRRTSSGTPANGIGAALDFEVETAAGNIEVVASLRAVTTDVTAASEYCDLVMYLMKNGAPVAEVWRAQSYGGAVFPAATTGNKSTLYVGIYGLRQNATNRLDFAYGDNAIATVQLSTGFCVSLNHGYAFSSANPIAATGSVPITAQFLSPSAGVVHVTDGSTGSGKFLSSVLVEANTAGSGAPNQLTAQEAGIFQTNEGCTAENYQTLPSAVQGLRHSFIVQDADGMRITANSGDTIRIGASVSAAAGFVRCATVGAWIELVAVNATEWFARTDNGTWTIDA